MAELDNQAEPLENKIELDPRSGDQEGGAAPKPESELLKLQLTSFLEIYKHHFDLFLKGVAGYFIVVGTLTNFALAQDATRPKGIAFSLAITIGSLIAFCSCVISKGWVEDLERALARITTALSCEPFPFSGAKGILKVMMLISAIFCIGGLVVLSFVPKPGNAPHTIPPKVYPLMTRATKTNPTMASPLQNERFVRVEPVEFKAVLSGGSSGTSLTWSSNLDGRDRSWNRLYLE